MKGKEEIELESWFSGLAVTLQDEQDGYKITLKGYSQIQEYFKREWEYWDKLNKDFAQRSPAAILAMVRALYDTMTNIDSLPGGVKKSGVPVAKTLWENIKKNKIDAFQPRLIHSRSGIGKFLTELYRKDKERGDGAYRYLSKQAPQTNLRGEIPGLVDACIYESIRSSAGTIGESLLKSLSDARNGWEQGMRDANSEVATFKLEQSKWRENFKEECTTWQTGVQKSQTDFQTAREKDLSTLETTYREKIKLEAPAQYWATRARDFKLRGRWWLGGFVVSVVAMVVLLTFILYDLPEPLKKNLFSGDPMAIKGLVILLVILSLGFYLCRIFARLSLSAFHLERDAEEREQLTYVFLALMKDKAVEGKERDIILQALFSRADTGLLGGDSSPTMPGFGGFVEQAVKGR